MIRQLSVRKRTAVLLRLVGVVGLVKVCHLANISNNIQMLCDCFVMFYCRALEAGQVSPYQVVLPDDLCGGWLQVCSVTVLFGNSADSNETESVYAINVLQKKVHAAGMLRRFDRQIFTDVSNTLNSFVYQVNLLEQVQEESGLLDPESEVTTVLRRFGILFTSLYGMTFQKASKLSARRYDKLIKR